jgi:hypothetical protein
MRILWMTWCCHIAEPPGVSAAVVVDEAVAAVGAEHGGGDIEQREERHEREDTTSPLPSGSCVASTNNR